MHDFLWLTLNWPWPLFVILLAIAVAIWVFTPRPGFFGFSLWGALAVSFVLYYGVVWELWPWVPGLFKLAWIVGLVAALVSLFWYTRIADVLASAGSGVALLIVAVLVFWQALFVPAWNALGLPHIEEGDVSHLSEMTVPPVVTNPPTGTTPDETPESPGSSSPVSPPGTGSFDCSEVSWAVSAGVPAKAPKVVRQGINGANTGPEAFNAIHYGWYDWAMDHPVIYHQLALAVNAATPTVADLAKAGRATPEMACLAQNVAHLMNGATYTPEHSDVLITLKDKVTSFRVMANTGQVH